jgi:Tol biopolymer transport system component
MDAGAGPATQLTHGHWHENHPAWSPDGRRLAFVASPRGNSDIYVADVSPAR